VNRHPTAAAAGSDSRAAEERVLSDISHELGNFFHKLYYWTDYLQEKRPPASEDTTATEMLGRTIRNLEGFLRVSLEYFRPLALSTIPMSVSDLVAGLLGQARSELNGTPLAVADAGQWNGATLLVDPGRLPSVFVQALRRVVSGVEHGRVEIAVRAERRGDVDGLEVRVTALTNGAAPAALNTAADVEWALAERVVALHGGELVAVEPTGEQRLVVLFLPFHA
jgi:hypothetical protein